MLLQHVTCILVFWFLWHLCCCIPPIRGTFESDRGSERRAIGARCASVTRKEGRWLPTASHSRMGAGRLHLGSQFLTSDLPALVCATIYMYRHTIHSVDGQNPPTSWDGQKPRLDFWRRFLEQKHHIVNLKKIVPKKSWSRCKAITTTTTTVLIAIGSCRWIVWGQISNLWLFVMAKKNCHS